MNSFGKTGAGIAVAACIRPLVFAALAADVDNETT
jgi:hypothetical protein